MPPISNTTNNSIKRNYDIHDRIYQFIIRIILLTNELPKTDSNKIIINQLLRCATSIGANDQEADGTLTKKDFVHTYTVVKKEAKETFFWLSLIADTNTSIKERMQPLITEGKEIIAIISKILINTRQ